jgi:hypothetical protein
LPFPLTVPAPVFPFPRNPPRHRLFRFPAIVLAALPAAVASPVRSDWPEVLTAKPQGKCYQS